MPGNDVGQWRGMPHSRQVERGLPRQAHQELGERGGVSGAEVPPVAAVPDALRHPADVRADHRHPPRQRLLDHHRAVLPPRRRHHDGIDRVEYAGQVGLPVGPGEADDLGDAGMGRSQALLELRAERVGAAAVDGDLRDGGGIVALDPGDGVEQDLQALEGRVLADEGQSQAAARRRHPRVDPREVERVLQDPDAVAGQAPGEVARPGEPARCHEQVDCGEPGADVVLAGERAVDRPGQAPGALRRR